MFGLLPKLMWSLIHPIETNLSYKGSDIGRQFRRPALTRARERHDRHCARQRATRFHRRSSPSTSSLRVADAAGPADWDMAALLAVRVERCPIGGRWTLGPVPVVRAGG